MAFLPFAFDARTVAPATELGAIPAGEYTVAITDSGMEPTKAGDGQFLKLVFTVLDGPHKGAKIFDRLNLVNRNQTVVDIAQRALSAICHAVRVFVIRDSAELHHKPLRIKVSFEPAKGEYGEQNRVKAYKPVTGSAPVAPTANAPSANAYEAAKGGKRPSQAAPATIPAAPSDMPWRRLVPAIPEPAPATETAADDLHF